MASAPNDPQAAFLQRIERRVRFLKTLREGGLGIFLPADERQRKQAVTQIVRMTARHSELPILSPDTLARAEALVREHLEAMQSVLPHDVQYRNRIKRNW